METDAHEFIASLTLDLAKKVHTFYDELEEE
jgi:hypothetical protein